MTSEEIVSRDWLLERGFAHVTPWHLRCLELFFESGGRFSAIERLWSDLSCTLEELHGLAQWQDARRTAEKSRGRFVPPTTSRRAFMPVARKAAR